MTWILETSPSYSFVFPALGSCRYVFFSLNTAHLRLARGSWLERATRQLERETRHTYAGWAAGALIEFLGCFAVLIGLLTRPFALGIALFVGIAMLKSHVENGSFLARRPGEHNGIEYTLALFAIAMALLVGGRGVLSADGLLSR